MHKFLKIEPMGSSAPNIPVSAQLHAARVESGLSVNLVAMAQANPIPKFRFVMTCQFVRIPVSQH
jgi:hypothetical protein